MRIIYMGTPDFAVDALEAIVAAGHEVVLVVTQPDKPKGRGKEVQITPVKACALKHDIPVFQPVKIKDNEAVETLKGYNADICVVAAFGQILSEEILHMSKFGCINIHASLLPKYRGAAPIQQAILDGEKESGVTIMQMDKGMDTGDILLQSRVLIDEKETGDSLHDKLAAAGAKLIIEALSRIEKGDITPIAQNDAESCYAGKLSKAMGKINWNEDAVKIERLVRGLNSWPGAYTSYNGKTLKIWESEVCDDRKMSQKDREAGMIEEVDKTALYVCTGKGLLKVTQVQLEGKKRMPVKEFLLGAHVTVGDILK
ncbi:MAG: methionyl-tRNA formyltransferase [Clostridiales bacterium]|nr:methionyl-tRNA formyltransferase [Clostridiales bacterium]